MEASPSHNEMQGQWLLLGWWEERSHDGLLFSARNVRRANVTGGEKVAQDETTYYCCAVFSKPGRFEPKRFNSAAYPSVDVYFVQSPRFVLDKEDHAQLSTRTTYKPYSHGNVIPVYMMPARVVWTCTRRIISRPSSPALPLHMMPPVV